MAAGDKLLGVFGRSDDRAELIAAGWEIFSALLFVSAVVPAAFDRGAVELVFLFTMALSAVVARPLLRRGAKGFAWAGALRVVAWPVSVAPLVSEAGPQVFVAALAFGLMAGGMRRAIYRAVVDKPASELSPEELRQSFRARLAETATMAGIVGGHIMLLFSVAFLRTQSQVIYRLWFDVVPALALLGTVAFTLAVTPATRAILAGLDEKHATDVEKLRRGLDQAERLPERLAYLDFCVWLACAAAGILYARPTSYPFRAADAVMQLGFAGTFAWGVAFYQRLFHRDITAPAVAILERRALSAGAELGVRAAEPRTLRQRMLRDFGLPLVFMAALSLLSSIGLYRTMGSGLSLREDFNAGTALVTSFAILLLALGVVVARAARDLSRPMVELARAADRVASGKLEAPVPEVDGPVEMVGLGESVERMREGLARTIAELERERAGLEEKVEARTAELQSALDELKRAQAALVQGERLASIGELVAGVAHEIGNPLNAVAGASVPLEELVQSVRRVLDRYRAIESELSPARRAELVALRKELDLDASLDDLVGISTVIRRAIDRSVRIVTNLRNFSRTSAEAVPTDLVLGIDETLMLLAPRLRQACIQVTKRFGELPPVVCRGGELNQVFMNLFVNAIQAIEGGAADTNGAEAEILVETWREGDHACFAVQDSGPGVPDALMARVFDPFFTTKPRGQGTGLGLSISTDIVRRHGGSLGLERSAGARGGPAGNLTGARFVGRLPIGGAAPKPTSVTRRTGR